MKSARHELERQLADARAARKAPSDDDELEEEVAVEDDGELTTA